MKKLIIMLIAWTGICLLSMPETEEKNNGTKEEIALADTELPSKKVSQPVLNNLP